LGSNLKIAINAASAKMGGAVTYLSNFLRKLPSPEGGDQFFVFLPSETAKGLPDLPASIRLCPLPDRNVGGWRRTWWEQVTLRRFLVREKIDVLFSTANFAMFRCPVKQILLVRNALYFSGLFQQMVLPRQRLRRRIEFRLRRRLIGLSVRSADVVTTPTQAMLDGLRGFVDVPPHKALVNPYGVRRGGNDGRRDIDTNATSQFEGSADTIRLVYLSLYNEYKNLRTLLNALPLLNHNGGRKYLLTTTVDPNWELISWMVTVEEERLLALRPDVRPWVTFVTPSDWDQTQPLYDQADIFVFPSLVESFGHPLVEAMTHGLPIIAADIPVNREVCGDAALYFSPLSAEDLAQRVRGLAEAPALMGKLGAVGRKRAARLFRWDRHVQRILECAGGAKEETPQPLARH
jgi:glycosyltransferase involved in cell wall biosynthesis